MREDDQLVLVPGAAGYINREIVVSMNGRTHMYSADLTALYPKITSNLIQQFMGGEDV